MNKNYVCGCEDEHEGKGLCRYHYMYYYEKRYYLSHSDVYKKSNKKYTSMNREKLRLMRKRYRSTEKGKEAIKRAIKKYEANHPERKNAWNKAKRLLRKPCIKCGKWAHKHHPNPIKPLEIIYLCPLHHKQEHPRLMI